MKKILQDRSCRLSILLTFIFFGTGIVFLFVGLADLNWILFILLPVVLGLSIGALPHKTYTIWGAVIADGDHAGVNVYTWFVGASLYRDGIANYHSPDFS